MARTANVFARVEPEIKKQAEIVLDQLGILISKKQLDAELLKGMDDIESDRVISADDVEADMRRLYGL